MTNTPPIHFDPEGLLPFDMPKAEKIEDEVDKTNTLIINELTPEQFEILSAGVFAALRSEKPSWVGKFAMRAIALAATMIVLAAAVRAIVFILQGVAVQ